jgi:hypothetical protein
VDVFARRTPTPSGGVLAVAAPRLLQLFRLRSGGGRQGASTLSAHARGGANAGKWRWELLAGVGSGGGGARVASEGLAPYSHPHPVFVGGGGVGLLGPVFCRYGPARIQGLLDGAFRPHPLSRRNYKGPVRFEGPVRHALISYILAPPIHKICYLNFLAS